MVIVEGKGGVVDNVHVCGNPVADIGILAVEVDDVAPHVAVAAPLGRLAAGRPAAGYHIIIMCNAADEAVGGERSARLAQLTVALVELVVEPCGIGHIETVEDKDIDIVHV